MGLRAGQEERPGGVQRGFGRRRGRAGKDVALRVVLLAVTVGFAGVALVGCNERELPHTGVYRPVGDGDGVLTVKSAAAQEDQGGFGGDARLRPGDTLEFDVQASKEAGHVQALEPGLVVTSHERNGRLHVEATVPKHAQPGDEFRLVQVVGPHDGDYYWSGSGVTWNGNRALHLEVISDDDHPAFIPEEMNPVGGDWEPQAQLKPPGPGGRSDLPTRFPSDSQVLSVPHDVLTEDWTFDVHGQAYVHPGDRVKFNMGFSSDLVRVGQGTTEADRLPLFIALNDHDHVVQLRVPENAEPGSEIKLRPFTLYESTSWEHEPRGEVTVKVAGPDQKARFEPPKSEQRDLSFFGDGIY